MSAYRLGRIDDYTDPLTGTTTPKAEVVKVLLEQAKAEYPDLEVYVEHLVHNGDAEGDDPYGEGGTSRWVREDKVPEGARSPKGGVIQRVLSAEQPQQAGGGQA